MGAPRITVWRNPGIWPKLTRDPYAPPSVDAPERETDEDGAHRLLYRGDEVVDLSFVTAGSTLTSFLYFSDRQAKVFVVRGGQDETKWLSESIGPGGELT